MVAALVALLALVLGPTAQAQPAPPSPVEGRTFTIATDVTFAPFEFQNADGQFVGIDMDLIRAIAEDQGFSVDIRPLGFDAALQAVQAGQALGVMRNVLAPKRNLILARLEGGPLAKTGVIAGMTITPAREAVFDFSEPYFESGVQMAVLENSSITSYEDLAGQQVAVKNGTEGADFAESIKDRYGFTTRYFADSASMYDEVRTGNSVAVFDDYPVLQYGITQGNGLKTVTEKESPSNYGFAVNKGANADLLAAFDTGLANLRSSGQYDEILNTYIGAGAEETDNSIPGLIKTEYKELLKGLWLTVVLTVISIVIALILGAIFGLFRVSTKSWLRAIGATYVAIFRGTPLLVQAFFIYFGIPAALGFTMTAFTAGIITLSLNAGAYMAEIVRGGILSVDKGQMEASRSLGISYLTSMRKVVMPQAIRTMIPSYINQFVITLKDTSILSVIGLAELTQSGRIIIARNFQSFNMWLIIAVMYFVIIMALTMLSNRLEKRINK